MPYINKGMYGKSVNSGVCKGKASSKRVRNVDHFTPGSSTTLTTKKAAKAARKNASM